MTVELEDIGGGPGDGGDPTDRSRVALWRRPGRFVRRHWVFASFFLVALIGVGSYAWLQVRDLIDPVYQNVAYTVPAAPALDAGTSETVYRIDPTQSSASYGIDEQFVGQKANHAVGTTQGIAGDFALRADDPSASRVGEIVVDLEQLHSDNSLRDARIRSKFLESHAHPLARFHTTALDGLPDHLVEGKPVTFSMTGDLTLRTATKPVTWDVSATTQDGRLTATATTRVSLSAFDVGPISIVGLVSTSDDAYLTLKLVALDPTRNEIPTEIAAPEDVVTQGDGPSYAKVVQPIIEQHCASCHTAGEVGAEHWKIADAGDVAKGASSVALVTTAKYMPPWPASTQGVPLAHSKALDPKMIKALSDWAGAGGQLDVKASTPIKVPKSSVRSIRHDVELRMPEPYLGSTENPNDYRCFVLDPAFTEPTYLTGYEFTPDQVPEIHHGQVFKMSAAARGAADGLSGSDGRPGWQCYTGPMVAVPGGDRAAGRSELFAGWAPGQDPVSFGEAGVLFEPGDFAVLQIHYHYGDIPTPDRSTVHFQTAPGSANLPRLRVMNPLAPVEIPCAPADVGAPLCDRDAALRDNERLYGPSGSMIESGLLAACRTTPEDLAATFDGEVAASSCDSRVPAAGKILQVLGHMHTLGRTFRMTLNPGTDREQILLDIPTWNFDWQMIYTLQTPARVEKGDTVRIECSWDRSLEPKRSPKYIVFAEGTEDEMCFNTYALVPDTPPGG